MKEVDIFVDDGKKARTANDFSKLSGAPPRDDASMMGVSVGGVTRLGGPNLDA